MAKQQKDEKSTRNQLPIAKKEDVDYSSEFADENDKNAVDRAAEADKRQES
ncbi:YfhD-like protein [Paenibacillus sp. 1_12]|uniref:YfhD family protein n=1 Tax=Paenibacillus sp. 1_12 TaxID=1566278 RepID=UPI0008ED5CA7|nr:YfhD family protein [Paenibacillus sp. 1_12]SFL33327.1 YfhD-like protein [Paenibacillus sp. 1_12]